MESLFKVLSKKSNSHFITIRNYKNSKGEVSNYSVILNFDYKKAVEKSKKILSERKSFSPDEIEAKKSILEALNKPSPHTNKDVVPARTKSNKIVNGVFYNKKTKKYYIFGRIVHKKTNASSANVKSETKSLKDGLRSICPISQIRQFELSADKMYSISTNGMTFVL